MRARRLLAAGAVLASTLIAPAAAQEPAERRDIRIDVQSLTGALTPKSQNLVIRARAVNTTQEAVRNLRVQLRFGSPLRGRSAIANGGAPARFGTRLAEMDVPGGELTPGGTADIEYEIPVERLPFDRSPVNGIYPMRVEVRSRFEVVGAMDTYVIWWPNTSPKMRIAMLWPLTEGTHRALGHDFYDDALAASVEDGRLNTLLSLGDASPMPLTWAVDPELLDALRRMTGSYTVNGREGTRGEGARLWLERARAALKDATVIPLPYADPDLAATSTGPLAVDAGSAFKLGRDLLRRDLGITGDPRLAWPPGDTLSPTAEVLLATQGVEGVVLPDTALPLAEALNHTPSAAAPLGQGTLGAMTALVVEPQLNRWVSDKTGEEGSRIAVQRFLADSAMAVLERPGESRDIVIAPPREWNPVRTFARQLLAHTVTMPWLDPVALDEVLDTEPSGAARARTPAGPALLTQAQTSRINAQRRMLQRVRGILTDPQRAPDELAQLDDALLRAVSSRWAADPGGWNRLMGSVDAGLRGQLDRVRLVKAGVVTMTGRSGDIPLTFENDLGQPVRIRVRLDSKQRLQIEGTTPYDARNGGEALIPPGRHTLVITGKATTGGLFPINVEVLSNDGARLGIGTTLRVRSTAYGAVALIVTGIAFGLLLVASATRLLRRRRDAEHEGRGAADREPQPA